MEFLGPSEFDETICGKAFLSGRAATFANMTEGWTLELMDLLMKG